MQQIVLNGLFEGLQFALLGLAFSVVFSTTRVLHVALGALYTIAPYLLFFAVGHGAAWSVAVAFAVGTAVILGVLCEELLHWPFLRKKAPHGVHIVGSLGLYLVLVQGVAIVWGNDVQALRKGLDTVFLVFGLRIARAQLVAGVASLAALAAFGLWIRLSAMGLQLRALADNSVLLELLGRNVRQVRRLVFGLSAALVSTAALGAAYDKGFDPHAGLEAVLIGLIATVVGGRGSFFGAAFAGLLIGVLQSLVSWGASSSWEQAVTFILLSLVLLVRPNGLFGRRLRLEETA